MHVLGGHLRYSLTGVLYAKVLRTVCEELRGNEGRVLAAVASELHACDLVCMFGNFLWLTPLYVVCNGWILYLVLGLPGLIGLGGLILIIPLQSLFGKLFTKYHSKYSEIAKDRVEHLNRLLEQLLSIKTHCLEDKFIRESVEFRDKEHREIRKSGALRASNMIIFFCGQGILNLLVFSIARAMGHSLSPETIFTSIALLSTAQYYITITFPFGIEFLSKFLVMCKRLQIILQYTEIANSQITHTNNKVVPETQNELSSERVHELPYGTTFIIGPVGSGKTTFLHSLLKENSFYSWDAYDAPAISEQKPVIILGTIRSNILFGRPYDPIKYEQVLEACCLADDLNQLPNGDLTVLGEGGNTLSGGQKARVGLARCAYSETESYLFDDPFSALDEQVAYSIMKHCMQGLLGNKKVLIATNNISFLPKADRVLVVLRRECVFSGSYEELVKSQEWGLDRGVWVSPETKKIHRIKQKSDPYENIENDNERFSIGWKTFCEFIRLGLCGGSTLGIVIGLFLIAECLHLSVPLYLAHSESSSSDFLVVLLIIVASLLVVSSIRTHFAYQSCLYVSKKLYTTILQCFIYARMEFHYRTPRGRLLTLLSKDISILDDQLPFVLVDFLQGSFLVVGLLVAISVITPLVLPPLCVLLLLAKSYYSKTTPASTHLRTRENQTSAVIQSKLLSAISGVVTIRSLRTTQQFYEDFILSVNTACSEHFWYSACSRYLQYHLDVLAVFLTGLICLLSVFLKGALEPGYAGASLLFSFSLTTYIVWTLRQLSETKAHFTSFTRLKTHYDLPRETTKGDCISITNGEIIINSLTAQYREELEPCLTTVNLHIRSKEKLGILGQTGSGKSSIFHALTRIIPFKSGSISIDNHDISIVSLKSLRKNISIIPQNPFIVQGTLRNNLELDSPQLTEKLQEVLSTVNLPYTECLECALEDLRLSQGELQLLCIARILLRVPKILLLDEITANLDPTTENRIISTIFSLFRESTILCISHRPQFLPYFTRTVQISHGELINSD